MLGEPLLLLDATGRRVFWTPMGGEITTHTLRSNGVDRKFDETSLTQRVEKGDFGWKLTRPYHKQEGVFFELIDEVHDWIVTEQGFARYVIDYRWLDDIGIAWAVGFGIENEAVAYKLRWVDC